MGKGKRATRTIGVSWHEPSRQFRKYIGKQIGRKGALVPKVFYLGSDEQVAIREATGLVAKWDQLKASGSTSWPGSREAAQSPMASSDSPRLVSARDITVGDAANLYLDELHQRASARQVSWAHYRHSHDRVERVVELLGRTSRLNSIGAAELTKAVLFFANRPPTKTRPHQKRPRGHPMAIKTVKCFVSQIKALFTWIAEHDRLEWQKPKRFDRIFKLRWSQLTTPDECERAQREVVSGEIETFTTDELFTLYRAARPITRLFILLGLNCGFTSSEISSLRTFEVFLDGTQAFIHRKRPKTGIEARWNLWPETVALIRRHQAPPNPGKLMFLSSAGNPLVEVTERSRRDLVKQMWGTLLKRAGLSRSLGFKFVKKTGADRIKKIGGLEVSEMYLAHAEPNSMNRHYANRNWSAMHRCLEQLREQLQELWALKADSVSADAPTPSPGAEVETEAA